MNSKFCDDRISKTGQVISFKCDLDLTLIYEVTQRAGSNISNRLYVGFIWLDTMRISSKSDVRLFIYYTFSFGVFFTPSPWFFTCGENLVPMSVE